MKGKVSPDTQALNKVFQQVMRDVGYCFSAQVKRPKPKQYKVIQCKCGAEAMKRINNRPLIYTCTCGWTYMPIKKADAWEYFQPKSGRR
jgi:hypothetical protein